MCTPVSIPLCTYFSTTDKPPRAVSTPVNVDLPPMTTPDGLFEWLIGSIVLLAALLLVVFGLAWLGLL